MTYRFRVIFEPEEEGGYHAWCPSLRAHSFGETLDEAKTNIQEAIEVAVESLLAHGEEVPYDRIEKQVLLPIEIIGDPDNRSARMPQHV